MREIQSLARGLTILDILINTQRPHTVTELAGILEVDKSSASRLLRTMENYGYVQQAPDSRAYTTGKRLHTIGWQLTNRYALRETARPYLDQLVAQTGECAHIGVYSSGRALVTDDVQPETPLLRVAGNSGRLIYLHNTAIGKGLLASGDFPLPDEFPQITPETPTDRATLEADLVTVRQQGYAIDDEENEPGVRCIASPVYDAVGVTVAAIGISGPTVRVTYENVESLALQVREVAHRLSCELGYEGDYPRQ
ncbi:MAG: IclR family transcriptional regulator [Chloroflexota bacterium]